MPLWTLYSCIPIQRGYEMQRHLRNLYNLIQVVCRSVNIFERLCKESTRHTCKVDAKQDLPAGTPLLGRKFCNQGLSGDLFHAVCILVSVESNVTEMHLHTQMKPWSFCLKSRSSFSRHYSLFAFCNFGQPSRLAHFGPLLTKLYAQLSTCATSFVGCGYMGSSKSKSCTSLLAIFTGTVVFWYIFSCTFQTHGGNFLLI